MKSLLASCPKCGHQSFIIQKPAEITYECFLKVPFTCKNCGYSGFVKVMKVEDSEIELVVE